MPTKCKRRSFEEFSATTNPEGIGSLSRSTFSAASATASGERGLGGLRLHVASRGGDPVTLFGRSLLGAPVGLRLFVKEALRLTESVHH